MPGQAKNILDHFYSFLVSGKDLSKKNILAIGTSGSPVDSDVWEGVRVILQKTAGMCGCRYEGVPKGCEAQLKYGRME